MQADSVRSDQKFFLQIKFAHFFCIIFQGCPVRQAFNLPGQPTPYNQLLIQQILLVCECYFA